MTGPERCAVKIARGSAGRHLTPRRLAKLAGIRVDAARRIIAAEARRRAA